MIPVHCKSHFGKNCERVCLNAICINLSILRIRNHFWRHGSHGTKQTAAMFLYQKNPMGIKLSCANFLLFQEICLAGDQVSENDLYLFYSSTD